MKETDFLRKLYKRGAIKVVEPNDNLRDSYLKKSESYLISAKILASNKRFEESVSMSYYSMYYSLLALLFKTGIKSENHTASIFLLKEIFNFDNDKILFAKKERIDKQYYVDFVMSEQDTDELFNIAEDFNAKIREFISKMINEDIEIYRNNFKKLVDEKEIASKEF